MDINLIVVINVFFVTFVVWFTYWLINYINNPIEKHDKIELIDSDVFSIGNLPIGKINISHNNFIILSDEQLKGLSFNSRTINVTTIPFYLNKMYSVDNTIKWIVIPPRAQPIILTLNNQNFQSFEIDPQGWGYFGPFNLSGFNNLIFQSEFV